MGVGGSVGYGGGPIDMGWLKGMGGRRGVYRHWSGPLGVGGSLGYWGGSHGWGGSRQNAPHHPYRDPRTPLYPPLCPPAPQTPRPSRSQQPPRQRTWAERGVVRTSQHSLRCRRCGNAAVERPIESCLSGGSWKGAVLPYGRVAVATGGALRQAVEQYGVLP